MKFKEERLKYLRNYCEDLVKKYQEDNKGRKKKNTRVCTECGKLKLLTEFNYRIKRRGYLMSYCKECQREYSKKYREDNKDKVREQKKKYYEANKDRRREQKKKYYEANKDRLREHNKKYYEANKDKIREKEKKYYEANKDRRREQKKKYREANKDRLREYIKKYREDNKDKVREYREASIVRINGELFNKNTCPAEIKNIVEGGIKLKKAKIELRKKKQLLESINNKF